MKSIRRFSRIALEQFQVLMLTVQEWQGPPPKAEMSRDGKIRYGCALWLLGLPLPIIILALFYRGCDW